MTGAGAENGAALAALNDEIANCFRCPRLVAWREHVAAHPPARHQGERYWARPIPGFGDPEATILLVGLAPAAHGGNRTGRVFTGDRSGDFLIGALHAQGLANQPTSTHAGDGLRLIDTYVAAAVRCAPPLNRPTIGERDTCAPYLRRELELLVNVRVIVPLGAFGWEAALRVIGTPSPRPRFGHGAEARVGRYTFVGTYHPSQQNTFTGKLTRPMLEGVLVRAREIGREATPGTI